MYADQLEPEVTTATATPDLTAYDWLVVNTSAGKDSQAMLDYVYDLAAQQGVTDRLIAVHADLGRVEWEGTRELAEAQAARYGVRFLAIARPQGDLLDHVEDRGMWPSSAARYCTSDHKRGQVAKVFTALARESRQAGIDRPVRILNMLGLRAQESPARAKLDGHLNPNTRSTGKGTVKVVTDWLPIHAWDELAVWDRIGNSRMADLVHTAYAAGMPRLSCVFCVMAPEHALVLAARMNPQLAKVYADLEARIDHQFTQTVSMADVADRAAALGPVTTDEQVQVADWAA